MIVMVLIPAPLALVDQAFMEQPAILMCTEETILPAALLCLPTDGITIKFRLLLGGCFELC